MDKPTLLLGLAFFLASAPNPDADAVAEMTANFIVPDRPHVLEASDRLVEPRPWPGPRSSGTELTQTIDQATVDPERVVEALL